MAKHQPCARLAAEAMISAVCRVDALEHAGVIAVYRQSRHFSSTKSSPPAMRRRRMGQPVWSCSCVMA